MAKQETGKGRSEQKQAGASVDLQARLRDLPERIRELETNLEEQFLLGGGDIGAITAELAQLRVEMDLLVRAQGRLKRQQGLRAAEQRIRQIEEHVAELKPIIETIAPRLTEALQAVVSGFETIEGLASELAPLGPGLGAAPAFSVAIQRLKQIRKFALQSRTVVYDRKDRPSYVTKPGWITSYVADVAELPARVQAHIDNLREELQREQRQRTTPPSGARVRMGGAEPPEGTSRPPGYVRGTRASH